MPSVVAVDIGGTRVRAAVVADDASILCRATEPVATPQDGDRLTAQVATLVRRVRAEAGTAGTVPAAGAMGLSLPAVLDRATGSIEWAPNLPGWNGRALRAAMEEACGLPVALEYDGHAAALGELWAGAGRGAPSFFFLIVGTGVGGGLVADGKLIRGCSNLAGAAGWTMVPALSWDPPEASRMGQLESLIAGPALARHASTRLGRAVTPREVFDQAASGHPGCREVVERALDHLGWALVNVVSLLNPAQVVIGGSVGLRLAEHAGRLEGIVRRFAQPRSAKDVRIVPAALGDDAGLLGAARSALDAAGVRPSN